MESYNTQRPFSRQSMYYPLHVYLSRLSNTSRVDIEFSQVEGVIGQTLPNGARSHRAWWANGRSGHSQSRAWLLAGWRVASVDLSREVVTFEQTGSLASIHCTDLGDCFRH